MSQTLEYSTSKYSAQDERCAQVLFVQHGADMQHPIGNC